MPEKLLNDQVIGQVKEVFEQLQEPVQLLFFGRKAGCEYCDDTLQLTQEIVDLSEKIDLSVYDLDDDASVAEQYGVDKAPGLVIAGKDGDSIQDYGVRYSGIPSGHEFSSFIHSIILVSSRDSGLSAQTREILAKLTEPVHLQVFVTPT
ncbi:MAG TPA: thioredoxin family protein [Anaerolineales bacterium]|nr:thioredoxin family protein [Anaerolineales bacterium]